MCQKVKREFISVIELKREFQIQYKQSPDLIVKQIENDSSSLIKFFKARSHVFKISLVKSDYRVALAQPNLTDLHSPSDLEQMLINLLKKLQVNPLENLITIETLESEVYQHYGVTITAIMKYLNLEDSLIKFLKSCKGFQIEKSGTSYQVGLA